MTHASRRLLLTLCLVAPVAALGTGGAASAGSPSTTKVKYDATNAAQYASMWANIYGPLELAAGGTLEVGRHGTTVAAVPFHVGADASVFDHLKYIGVSTESFAVPETGSLEFAVDITADTSGTDPDRVIRGCSGGPFSYPSLDAACAAPYEHTVLEGQQAGVVLNMINFDTGQLFDWFVSDNQAFALIERLPSSVTGVAGTPIDLAYTQIIAATDIKPGKKHKVAIRYTRGPATSRVEYFLDGKLFASVDDVGVPLDVQGVPFTGYAPAIGHGEPLKDRLDSFQIGHGLFSLLDAFPYQDAGAPELSVSFPMSERLFGQGAVGTWDKFVVTTRR
jgi:hypothetical protein